MLGLAATCAGFALLAASMHRHGPIIVGHRMTPPERRLWRVAGAAVLLLSAVCTIAAAPARPLAVPLWFGYTAAAMLIVTLAVRRAPRLLLWLALGFVATSGAAAAMR